MSDVKCPERLYAFDTPSRNYLNYSHSPSSPSPDSINDDPLPSSQDQIDSHPSLADDLPPTDDFLAGAAEVDPTANASSPSSSLSLLSLSRDEKEQATRGHRKVISIHAPNPSHLFWVPAAQHPEIAPAEFEKFLRAGAIAKRERASLRRRSSILSVSFTANDAAKQDSEDIAEGEPQHPQQALEISNTRLIGDQGLVDAESEAQRKTRLRRSISLDTAKAAAQKSSCVCPTF
ncbi:hypothetical protein BX666DRAFT_300049 [Dichotomocladium elegans]|nr:hypothetical protein BX666DRAFT_300049 [Dichotomocladium elegans]